MLNGLLTALLIMLLALHAPARADRLHQAQALAEGARPAPTQTPAPDGLTAEQKAAIVAAIIAASVAAYLALGRPCACPYSTMRNGAACGARSAWSKPGGLRPLCYPTDITDAIFSGWMSDKKLPPLR